MSIESIQAIIGSGCVLYLTFEERGGRIVYDQSGNNNNGTIYGASWNYGKFGRALYFDGIDDHILVNNSPSLNVSSITLCAWTYPTEFGTDRVIISKNYTSGNRSYEIRFLPDGRIRFVVILEGDVIVFFDTPVSAEPNKWNFVAATYTSGQPLRIYLNKTKYESSVTTGRIQSSDIPLTVGCRSVLYLFFKGIIDDVRVYNRALSDKEIRSIYYRGIKIAQEDQISYNNIYYEAYR
jgi:signal peptidase I